MGFFIEATIGGLMSGMLYALVALGFVLIFKASGVFNFAQGAMVLFAALAMARFAEWIPQYSGLENKLLVNVLAFVGAMGVMIASAWLIERLVLGKLVNQEGITLLMATLGITYFHHPLAWCFDRLWPAREGFNLQYAARFKERLKIPVICVGGFITRESMEKAVREGYCDAVSVARAMIADPYLYRHLKEGVKGPQCTFCNACIARAGRLPVDCYDPDVRREKDAMLKG